MLSRNWCYTLNNYTDDEHLNLLNITECKYHIFGKEVGLNGTPHIQGFIVFPNQRRLKSVKQIVGERAHCEKAMGNSIQNRNYCMKEGDFIEYGDRPLTQEEKGNQEKIRWDHALKEAKTKGEVTDERIQFLHYNTIKKVRYDALLTRKLDALNELNNEWWYGKPGTGKSRKGFELYPQAYRKNPNNEWWDGYNDEEVVIIEDLDNSHHKQFSNIKRWADHYPFLAEIKGGMIKIRPKKIIITSNYKIEEITGLNQMPILRRFKEVNFD